MTYDDSVGSGSGFAFAQSSTLKLLDPMETFDGHCTSDGGTGPGPGRSCDDYSCTRAAGESRSLAATAFCSLEAVAEIIPCFAPVDLTGIDFSAELLQRV